MSGGIEINRKPNIDLGKTQITLLIRVSSAAIFYEEYFGNRYQIETLIFSDDPRQRFKQIIHGSCSGDNENLADHLVKKCQKIHKQIADNLMNKYGEKK